MCAWRRQALRASGRLVTWLRIDRPTLPSASERAALRRCYEALGELPPMSGGGATPQQQAGEEEQAEELAVVAGTLELCDDPPAGGEG